MGNCCDCQSGDAYEISTEERWAENIENSVLEYRFMIGKHMNNYDFKKLFKDATISVYNGSEYESSICNKEAKYFLDIRRDFIYGVYANKV
jgi:hypothetical protein